MKHWIRKGYDPKEAAVKAAEFQSAAGLVQNNYPEQLTKRSEMNFGDNNPMSLVSIASREGITLAEARKLTPCHGRTGESHPMFGKKHTEEALRKIDQNLMKSSVSKPEAEMSEACLALMTEGKRNEPINGWSCDFVSHEHHLIIEFLMIFGIIIRCYMMLIGLIPCLIPCQNE